MKNILCYGDSNTWGYVPGTINFETGYIERYPKSKRWPGILQSMLGKNCEIIEEGLCGRQTNIENLLVEGANGKTYLSPCLYSHAPLNCVILFLGINDLQAELNRNSDDVIEGISELIQIIKASTFGANMQSPPKILLLGYPRVTHENWEDGMFLGAIEKAKEIEMKLCQSDVAAH